MVERKLQKGVGRSVCEGFKMTEKISMLRACSIEGMERKENFRQEEEENFPALLCVTGSKAGSEETA